MTNYSTILTAAFFLVGACAACGCKPSDSLGDDRNAATQPAGDAGPKPFALVELFTSEGCSSCPPAERVLGNIADDPKLADRVMTIAFHVDYWDHLGWRDRFDDPKYSARQSAYARSFKSDSVYTPQMVVNGRREFVGSDRTAAREAIAAALREPPKVDVQLSANFGDASSVHVKWKMGGAVDGTTLRLVLVENGLSVSVERGENAGRVLEHPSVVRAMAELPLSSVTPEGTANLSAPADAKAANLGIVGFVQSDDGLAVLGAAKAQIASPQAASRVRPN